MADIERLIGSYCRHLALGRDPDPARRYFFRLECETHRDLAPFHLGAAAGARLQDVSRVFAFLEEQLRLRNRALQRRQPPRIHRPTATLAPAFERIEQLQRDLILDAFGSDPDPHDRAFEQFSNGQLRIKMPDGWETEPSSGYFFLFAEFALTAHACAVHEQRPRQEQLWLAASRVMVRSQEVMVEAYAAGDETAGFGSYLAENYRGGVSDEALAGLRRRYQDFGPEELLDHHARNCVRFLPGEVAG